MLGFGSQSTEAVRYPATHQFHGVFAWQSVTLHLILPTQLNSTQLNSTQLNSTQLSAAVPWDSSRLQAEENVKDYSFVRMMSLIVVTLFGLNVHSAFHLFGAISIAISAAAAVSD